MRTTLQLAARLLDDVDVSTRAKGAQLAYELCLARCVAPITPQATPQVVLGRDYDFISPVLRRLASALHVAPTTKENVDLVITSARALAAVAALLVFAQRCDVHAETLASIAGPLRSLCAPALVSPLLATDLRVVSAARDALDQVVLLRVAHHTPWIDVLLALRSFREHYASAAAQDDATDKSSLLNVVLVRTAGLMRDIFVSTTTAAMEGPMVQTESDDTPEGVDVQQASWLRRRSSVSIINHPTRASTKISRRRRESADGSSLLNIRSAPHVPSQRRSRRLVGRLERLRPLRGKRGGNGPSDFGEVDCGPSDREDSFEAPAGGMGFHFSKKLKRISGAEHDITEPDSLGSKVSLESTRNPIRRSVDIGKQLRSRRVSANASDVRRIQSYHRRRKKEGGPDSLRSEVEPGCTWKGRQLGVGNRDIFSAMHIYERLLSSELLPEVSDRSDVIDDIRRLFEPLLSGSAAEQLNLDRSALRCVVSNAFIAHGRAIYPSITSLVFRPAPSSERTAEVKRHLSLQPDWMADAKRSSDAVKPVTRKSHKASDFRANIVESMGALDLARESQQPKRSNKFVCLPNSECDNETALRCTTLLTMLMKDIPQLCTPRLPIITGTTNSAYWHCSEGLIEPEQQHIHRTVSVTWDVNRLYSAVNSLLLLNLSLPDSHDKALECISNDPEELDTVIETCMRSVCATGCRLARIDARHSEQGLTDSGIVQCARGWTTLSKLPSESVLWPNSPAYSSAVVFVAHLARRAAGAVYERGIWAQLDSRRENTSRFVHEANKKHKAGKLPIVKTLESCVGVLVNRNGSAVVVHDLFRTLLYIIGCELRGSPTRSALTATSTLPADTELAIPRTNASAASLPSRAPFFTRAAHQESPRPDVPIANDAHHSCSDIDVVDVQSLNRLSLDESDMSGLLVGNIAVDGSRDCKLREIAAKAEGSAVATWFTGIAPPSSFCSPPVPPATQPMQPLRRRARSSSSADRLPGPSDAFGVVATRIGDDHFEELCTSCALVLDAVSVSAAFEQEDATVPMEKVASDVTNAKCQFVTRMHERAIDILGRSHLGGVTRSNHNPNALVQEIKTMKSRMATMQSEIETLKTRMNVVEESDKRSRWPLKAFPRNLHAEEAHHPTHSLKRASYT